MKIFTSEVQDTFLTFDCRFSELNKKLTSLTIALTNLEDK